MLLGYVVQRRPLLDQADQLIFGFFGPDRHVLRKFAIFTATGVKNRRAPCHARASVPVPVVLRVAFWDKRCSCVTAADPTLTAADGGKTRRRPLTTWWLVRSVGVGASRQTAPETVTTAELPRHVMHVDLKTTYNTKELFINIYLPQIQSLKNLIFM